MYSLKLGKRRAPSGNLPEGLELGMLSIPFWSIIWLIYLNGVVAATDHISLSRSVPSKSSSNANFQTSISSSSSSSPPSSSLSSKLSHSERAAASPPHPHPHLQHNYGSSRKQQHQPQLQPPSPASPTEAYSPSWYNSHVNDPRMGFYFSSGPSAPAPSVSPSLQQHPHHKSAPLVASPRSFPDFPFHSSSPPSAVKKKKRKKKVKKSKAFVNNSDSATPAGDEHQPHSTDLATVATEPERSRTFLITPILAWLIPVFMAQLFGMGMIPAAAFITLPIFLLPVGLAAAVFLV